MVESQSVRVFLGCGTRHIGALWTDGWLTAFVGDTTMALVEHGALPGSRQRGMGNVV